jgi:hypothetical protein
MGGKMKTSLVDNRTWLQVDGKWHRLDCIEQIFKWKKDHDRYVSKYPNHCRVCNGSGVHVSSENAAPHGSGHYWPMRTDSECDACIGKNTCPMCGKQHGKDWKADECECGWNWQGFHCDHKPEEWQCFCDVFEPHPLDDEDLMAKKRIRPFYIT